MRRVVVKTEAVAERGMVAAQHPLAAEAGLEILREGGNAVDAAVATAFAVGAAQPWMSGLGGGGFLVLYRARDRRVRVFDFNVVSPRAAHAGMYRLGQGVDTEIFPWRVVVGRENVLGPRAVCVPGAPAGLARALAEEGTRDLATILGPAVRIAREGFPLDWFAFLQLALDAPYLARFPESAAVYFEDGFPRLPTVQPTPVRLRQPDLARTLELLAREGVEGFYRGELARRIAAHLRERGGVLDAEDLAAYEVLADAPHARATFRGAELHTSGAPSGGPAVTRIVGALEASGHGKAPRGSVETLEAFAVAAREVLHERYATPRPDVPSTTHLCVVDAERNMVSLTLTLLSRFGSRVIVPGTGVVLNNGMLWFDPEPGKPNSIRGSARPLANMAPALVVRDGSPLAALGAAGGRRIMCAVASLLADLVAYGMSMQEAIAAPRLDASTDRLLLDARFGEDALAALAARGHDVVAVEESFHPRQFASPVGILVDADGRLYGGADPFSPATCLGL